MKFGLFVLLVFFPPVLVYSWIKFWKLSLENIVFLNRILPILAPEGEKTHWDSMLPEVKLAKLGETNTKFHREAKKKKYGRGRGTRTGPPAS